jgi:DNA-binding LytR/AlgR family response regulator
MESSFFFLPNKKRKYELIYFKDILYLEGSINYTLFHLKDGRVKVSPRTLLYHIQRSLDESFIRVHRAFCINKTYLDKYDAELTPNYLHLKGGIRLAVSRRKRKALEGFTRCANDGAA